MTKQEERFKAWLAERDDDFELDIWDFRCLQSFIQSESDLAIAEERKRIWKEMFGLAEPDERQFGAGDINTNLDIVRKIINPS